MLLQTAINVCTAGRRVRLSSVGNVVGRAHGTPRLLKRAGFNEKLSPGCDMVNNTTAFCFFPSPFAMTTTARKGKCRRKQFACAHWRPLRLAHDPISEIGLVLLGHPPLVPNKNNIFQQGQPTRTSTVFPHLLTRQLFVCSEADHQQDRLPPPSRFFHLKGESEGVDSNLRAHPADQNGSESAHRTAVRLGRKG